MKKSYPKVATHLTALLLAFSLTSPATAETSMIASNSACNDNLMHGSLTQLNPTHATVKTSVLINSAAEDVWNKLTDFDNISSWSSGTLQNMKGDIKNGGSVMITFIFGVDENGEPNSNEIPHTLIYEEGKMFGWSDPFPEDIGGGRDNHVYQVESCGDQTLFVQSDEIIDNPYAANFVAQLLPMYQTFNAELKAFAEN